MGWWKIRNVESGQIDHDFVGAVGTANAIPGKDTRNALYGGDGPADIMDVALKEIVQRYREAWGRPPHMAELQAVFNFCTGPERRAGAEYFDR